MRTGQSAPNSNGTYSSFSQRVAHNNSGQIAFIADLTGTNGGGLDDRGIFTSDGIDTFQVAREGDVFAGSTIASIGGNIDGALNNHGQIAYHVYLADGNQHIRRWTPDLHWRGAIGTWDNSSNWTLGLDPAQMHRVYIDNPSGGVVLGPSHDTAVQQLVVGGSAASMLVLQSGITIEVANGLAVTPLGILAGSGMIDGSVSVRGTLRPSTGPQGIGSLQIGGNLELVESVLQIDLAGESFGQWDYLNIMGDMLATGELIVSVDPAFLLGPNMEFLFAEVGGTLTGTFDGLSDMSLVGNYGGRDLFITYGAGDGNDIALFTAVPEPSTSLLMGLFALAASFCRVRKSIVVNSDGPPVFPNKES